MSGNEKMAVALLGHGSRAAGASEGMETVARRLRESGRYAIVEACHMAQLRPSLPDALAKCAEQGATTVIVLPYFLHMGIHVLADIPDLMREAAGEYPDMKIVLGKHLGFDEVLVGLVEKRVGESMDLDDVRTTLPATEDSSVC